MNAAYIEKWLGYLTAADREMSRLAAEKLGKTGSAAAVPGLVSALTNRPADVRAAAARALGELGFSAAIPALAKTLHDSDPFVACAAAAALGRIGDRSAVQALRAVVAEYTRSKPHYERTHSHDRGVYVAALDALAHLG